MSEQQAWLVLFCFEIVGLWGSWIVGSGRWWGWVIVMSHSIPWLIFSIIWGRWGAALMPPLWWIVQGSNAIRWRREEARASETRASLD
jgi:hypothetical protein